MIGHQTHAYKLVALKRRPLAHTHTLTSACLEQATSLRRPWHGWTGGVSSMLTYERLVLFCKHRLQMTWTDLLWKREMKGNRSWTVGKNILLCFSIIYQQHCTRDAVSLPYLFLALPPLSPPPNFCYIHSRMLIIFSPLVSYAIIIHCSLLYQSHSMYLCIIFAPKLSRAW